NKNVGISISKFLKLAEITNINLDKEKIRIHTKGKSLPAILELNEDFLTFLGLWIAEGSYNDKSGVRVSINDSEIEEVKKLLEKLLGKVTVYKKKSGRGRDVYINSTVLAKIMRHVFKLEGGARRKRIPDFVFNLNKRTIAAFLHGYFSGDGSIYPNQHGVLQVEASTESKMLADDLMYLLLYFDIVAKNYERKRENGNQQRIVFTGADNLERFKEIGFMNNSKNLDIGKYLQNINWRRSRQIPITQNIRNLVLSNNELSSWGNSLSIGASVLIEYPEFQNIANNDIYWDRVEKVEEVSEKYQYVYDISVSPTENFVAGFGGIFAHNSEENLRKIFEDAEKNAPSIIFIDEIDALAPKREEVSGEVERRVVSTLLTQMDGLVARGKVIVIAATNRPNAVDPALRRGGRFDREIEIGVPNKQGRKEILQIHTRHMPLEKDISLEELADVTYGYVGADISALTKEAAMHALRRVLPEISALKEGESIPKEILEKLRVSKKDFEYALRMVQPSAMREVLIEVPKVKWSDVGGLEDVKKRMKEAIEWPLKHPDSFERIGIKPPRGILLYGPPGCGKTLLAKAVANEAGANFILINGPEVFSKWVGESERMIRNVFRRAKQVAPSIIFIDEIDALAPKRGVEIGTRVTEQVVSQLLTEMSGVQELKDVVILAATNRPDILDSALLRPGRFDRLIYVPSPDEKARLEIFKVHTRNMPLKGVDIKKLAKITEGYSGADIEALVREAALYSLRENIKSKEVNSKHFDKAIKKIKPSITADMFKKYQKAVDNLKKTSLDETRYIG
ncbi:MAG: AAA family ATPase, partial [Methanosarcinales archaeon]